MKNENNCFFFPPRSPSCDKFLQDGKSCLGVCDRGYYADNATMTCQKCAFGCQNCDAQRCYSCYAPYYLDLTQFTCGCPVGQVLLENLKCQDIASTSFCIGRPYIQMRNGQCVSACDTDQYLDAVTNRCYSCSANCQTCSSASVCTACRNGYQVDLRTLQCTCSQFTLTVSGVSHCVSDAQCGTSRYPDKATGQCLPCGVNITTNIFLPFFR